MRKQDELSNPRSCLNKAREREMTFVLLGRDGAAPWVIRFWCVARWLMRKNSWKDEQIQEALQCARTMAWENSREPVSQGGF